MFSRYYTNNGVMVFVYFSWCIWFGHDTKKSMISFGVILQNWAFLCWVSVLNFCIWGLFIGLGRYMVWEFGFGAFM